MQENHYNTIKHIYNEYNFSYCDVDFDINEPSDLTQMVPVIRMDSTLPHAHLCYTWDHMMAGTGCLIKLIVPW